MEKWEKLKIYTEVTLIDSRREYEGVVERQLEQILEHMNLLEVQSVDR